MTTKQLRGTPFFKTAGTTTANSITATQTAGTTVRNYITDISGSSDKNEATLIVKEGSTIIWQEYLKGGGYYHHSFVQPIGGTQAGTITTITVTGTLVANANMAGFQLDTE